MFILIKLKLYLSIRSQKENLKLAEAQEEQRLLRVQKNYIELEMRKFRRKKMILLHDLENQLLRDVNIILINYVLELL